MGLPSGIPVSSKEEVSQIWDILNGTSSISDGKSHTPPSGCAVATPNESSETTEPTHTMDRVMREYQSYDNGNTWYSKYDRNCGDGLCRTDTEEEGKIEVIGYEELKEEGECNGCITLSHENLNIPMHMIILDVPDGGVFYKYSSPPYRDPKYVPKYMEEVLNESRYCWGSAINLFNIEQITGQFIKDYQMGNLTR